MNIENLLIKFRTDPLCRALRSTPEAEIIEAIQRSISDPEITGTAYLSAQLEEAIVMLAAHRIAYGAMFELGSQSAIAQGKPFYDHDGCWLQKTPYGARLIDLQNQAPNLGAIAISEDDVYYEY